MSRSNIGEASNENQDYEEEEEEEEIENQTGVEDEHQEDDTQRLQEPQNEENDDDYYEDEDGPGTYNDQTDERQDLTEDRRPNPNQNQSSQEPYEQESDTQNLNDDETDPRHSQIHLKNSITQIYKNREYPVSNNSGDTTDPSVEKLRRDMAIMKQLICCYELNRQGLVKQLGNLTEKKPKLLNDMNQESVENMILLENYIEQYLSQIRFDVTEELKAFDYPDGQAREYSNQNTRLEPFQLQHHLSSHMKEQLEFNSVQTRTQQQHSQKEQTTSYAHKNLSYTDPDIYQLYLN